MSRSVNDQLLFCHQPANDLLGEYDSAATQFDPNAPISAHRPVPDRTTSARSNPAAPGLRSRG